MNKIEFLASIDKYKGEDHSDFLQHYGILGQKWGQRRWQNPDGTFNDEGKIRYFGSKAAEQRIGSTKTNIPKKVYEANKNDPQSLKILEDYYKNHRDKENKDPETKAMDKFYSDKEDNYMFLNKAKQNPESKESITDKLNAMLEKDGKRINDLLKRVPEKNDNNKYEDEYGEYDDPDFDAENEKISGLFKKTDEEKEFKEAKRLAQKLNFDNGTKVIKELKNTEYGKKHIKPIYDEYEENMNKLSDKANKIIKDNPVDEIEAGIANAIDTSGGNANIGYIINCIRKQHYANSADGFINVDSLPLLKSEEDLWTEALKYKKDFGDKIEKEFKNLYPKAKTNLSYFIALTDYENDKLDKIYDMNDEDYRRYQLYHQINYGLVPEINKKSIRKDIIEPAEKLYPKVEKIINNTKVGDPSYDWSDIGKALVELGLDKKNADELTNADWKKVYEICSQ